MKKSFIESCSSALLPHMGNCINCTLNSFEMQKLIIFSFLCFSFLYLKSFDFCFDLIVTLVVMLVYFYFRTFIFAVDDK